MNEKMKKIYQVPDTQIVQLRLHSHLAERTPGIGGGGWEEFNPNSNKSEQGGRENRGSFFDEDEADDGGYKKFQLWDSADSN